MPVFPTTIAIKDLVYYNSEFNLNTIKRHEALYRGGEHFKKLAREFLFQREIEKSLRTDLYNQRLERTAYTPHAAVIDFLVSSVMKSEVVVTGPSPYWDTLNTDADGDGTDLAMIARNLLLDSLLHGRSWLEIFFGDDYLVDNDTNKTDENSPKNEARLQVVPPSMVNDWGDGWARIYTISNERDLLWGPMTRTTERWSYLTDKEIVKYEYVKENDPVKNSKNSNAFNATLIGRETHDLGICPLLKMSLSHPGMWIMNRIDQLLVQIYNRESALQFALDQGCYSLLVLNLNTTLITQVYASEVAALKLTTGEMAGFISPDVQIYEAAMKDIERSRTELGRVIHAATLEQASKVQSPRATGTATKIQQSPMEALLSSYAAPVIDVLTKAFTAIALMRGEDPNKVIISGMDDFTGAEDEDLTSSDEDPTDTSGVKTGISDKEK